MVLSCLASPSEYPFEELPQEPLINAKMAQVLSLLLHEAMSHLGHPSFVFSLNETLNCKGGKVDLMGRLIGPDNAFQIKLVLEGKVHIS